MTKIATATDVVEDALSLIASALSRDEIRFFRDYNDHHPKLIWKNTRPCKSEST